MTIVKGSLKNRRTHNGRQEILYQMGIALEDRKAFECLIRDFYVISFELPVLCYTSNVHVLLWYPFFFQRLVIIVIFIKLVFEGTRRKRN